MTSPLATVIGVVIIGASIIGARLIAPYEFASGVDATGNPFLWRANVVTGDVQICAAKSVINDRDPFSAIGPNGKIVPKCE